MADGFTRTTLTLPADLLAQVDRAISEGKAPSRNAFVATALRHELDAAEEAAIDSAFAAMADDADYRAEAERMSEEFLSEEWQILRSAEGKS